MPRKTLAKDIEAHAPYGAVTMVKDQTLLTELASGKLSGHKAVQTILKNADLNPGAVKKNLITTAMEPRQILPIAGDVQEIIKHAGEVFLLAGDKATSVVLYVSTKD